MDDNGHDYTWPICGAVPMAQKSSNETKPNVRRKLAYEMLSRTHMLTMIITNTVITSITIINTITITTPHVAIMRGATTVKIPGDVSYIRNTLPHGQTTST